MVVLFPIMNLNRMEPTSFTSIFYSISDIYLSINLVNTKPVDTNVKYQLLVNLPCAGNGE